MWIYIKKMIEISLKKVLVYPFEVLMLLVYSIFELAFILLFWWSIGNNFILPKGYVNGHMFLFSAMVMLSSGFQEVFFGVIILPYDIKNGNLDNYLVMPKNIWLHYLLDKMNLSIVLEKLLIGLVALVVSIHFFSISVNMWRIILAVALLFFANLIFALLGLMISFIAFWKENIDNFRNLIYSSNDIKKYPLGFFSKKFQSFFLNVIPIGLITYYPFELLIDNVELEVSILLRYSITFVVFVLFTKILAKKGLKIYESNN